VAVYASAIYPVPNRFVNVGKEPAPGTVTAGTYTLPVTQFKPVDKYTYLEDAAWRNAMAELYNLVQGVRISDISIGGPLFADGIGYPLMSICGDYWQAVSGGVTGTTSSLSGSVSIGATTVVVASGTGISVGQLVSIGGTGTTAQEVRQVSAISAGLAPGTLTLNSALYQGHASGGTVIAYSSQAGITHNFALLNSGLGGGGSTASQPPTYTYEDFSGVPAASGARQYAYACYSEVTITGEAAGLVTWDGKITAIASVIAASTPTTSLTSVIPQPAWNSTVQLGGAGTNNSADWKLTLSRKLSPKFTNSGQQDPFAIARGAMGAALSFTFDPASDESEFLYYLANSQPTAQITATNGLPGTNLATLVIKAQVAAFDTGELDDSKDVFGFVETVKCVANTTNAGPSAGFSPISIALTNGVINY